MSTQPTAEKSVQTHESTGLVSTPPASHLHAENAAAEVANTLVSMATGRQRLGTNNAGQSTLSVSTPPSLPILSLADYTTAHGVPTAMSLANQAKISPAKQDDSSMSTDEYQPSTKTRTKSSKRSSATNDVVQYGPLLVKPRKSLAPTLANGRRSKDEPVSESRMLSVEKKELFSPAQLPPAEDHKRRQRRDRNKEAAAKCRQKRNDLREQLEKVREIVLSQHTLTFLLVGEDPPGRAEDSGEKCSHLSRAKESTGSVVASTRLYEEKHSSRESPRFQQQQQQQASDDQLRQCPRSLRHGFVDTHVLPSEQRWLLERPNDHHSHHPGSRSSPARFHVDGQGETDRTPSASQCRGQFFFLGDEQ